MIVKLLTEHHLEFLSLKRCCTGSSESTLVKMPHCWKLHVTAHMSVSGTSQGSLPAQPVPPPYSYEAANPDNDTPHPLPEKIRPRDFRN